MSNNLLQKILYPELAFVAPSHYTRYISSIYALLRAKNNLKKHLLCLKKISILKKNYFFNNLKKKNLNSIVFELPTIREDFLLNNLYTYDGSRFRDQYLDRLVCVELNPGPDYDIDPLFGDYMFELHFWLATGDFRPSRIRSQIRSLSSNMARNGVIDDLRFYFSHGLFRPSDIIGQEFDLPIPITPTDSGFSSQEFNEEDFENWVPQTLFIGDDAITSWVPQSPLVGIELNPGPVYDLSRHDFDTFDHLYEDVVTELQFWFDAGVYTPDNLQTQMIEFEYDVETRDQAISDLNFYFSIMVLRPSDIMRREFDLTIPPTPIDSGYSSQEFDVNVHELIWTHSNLSDDDIDWVPQAPLVGVELNPGPNKYNSIVAFLKNGEKRECVESAWTDQPSRTTKKKSTNIFLKEKEIIKNREKKIHMLRSLKSSRNDYVCEGIFDVGISDESKLFITDTVNKLRESIGTGLDVKVDYISCLKEAVADLKSLAMASVKIIQDFIKWILSFLSEFCSGSTKVLVEAIQLSYDFFVEGVLEDTVLMSLHAKYLKDYLSEKRYLDALHIATKLKDTRKDVKNSIEFFFSFIREIIMQINLHLGVNLPTGVFTQDSSVDAFYQRFFDLRKLYETGKFPEVEFSVAVHALREDIDVAVSQSTEASAKEKLVYLSNCFRPLVNYVEANINPNNGSRIEPLCIAICGDTGAGKSTLTMPLLLALLARILPPTDRDQFMKRHNDFITYRCPENEYWDGTKEKNCCYVYDDAFQEVDAPGTGSNIAFEVIRLKNTAPYHLHFSGVQDKTKHFAHPKLLFLTMNMRKLKFNSIYSPNAVIRRFDFGLVQCAKLEFCTDPSVADPYLRHLDLDKVYAKFPPVSGDPMSYYSTEIAEWHDWDFKTGHAKQNGRIYTFDQLVEICSTRFKDLQTKGEHMLSFHQAIKKKYFVEGGMLDDDNIPLAILLTKHQISALDKCLSYYQRFVNLFKFDQRTIGKWLMFAGCITTLCGGYKMYSHLSSLFTEATDYDKSKKAKRVKKASKQQRRINLLGVTPVEHSTEGGAVQNTSFLTSLIRRNMYIFEARGKTMGWALFIRDRTFVIPRHFDDLVGDDDKVEFRSPITGLVSFAFEWKTLTRYFRDNDQCDYIFFDLPEVMCRLHNDITEAFVDESYLKDGYTYQCQMVTLREKMYLTLTPDVVIKRAEPYTNDTDVYHGALLQYSAQTQNGDCGTPIITLEGRFSRPTIFGIHVAGTSSRVVRKWCIGQQLSKQLVMRAANAFGAIHPVQYTEELIMDDLPGIEAYPVIKKNVKQPRMPVESKILRTPLYDQIIPAKTKPAHLTPFLNNEGVRIDPQKKAFEKYLHDEPCIDYDVLHSILPHVAQLLLTKTFPDPWEPRVFTFEEAVSGVPGVDFCEALCRSTSPGWPFCLNNKSKGKKHWLGDDGPVDFSSPGAIECRALVDNFLKSLRRNARTFRAYVSYAKDERKKIEKVDEGKTRQFNVADFVLSIVGRMYFGDFIRHMCSNRIFNGTTIGIKTFEDWASVRDHLIRFDDYLVLAGDFGGFDTKMPVPVSNASLTIIERYYYNATPEERMVRENIFQHVINSMHIYNSCAHEFVGSVPSGYFATAEINTMDCIILVYYVLEILRREYLPDITLDQLFSNSKIVANGDDHILSYSPLIQSICKMSLFVRTMPLRTGMEYTPADKSTNIVENQKITDVTYLKRGFLYDDGMWKCPLDLDVILETLMWEKKDANIFDMYERSEGVLCELAQHTKDVYKLWAPKIVSLMMQHYNYACKHVTYERALTGELALTH